MVAGFAAASSSVVAQSASSAADAGHSHAPRAHDGGASRDGSLSRIDASDVRTDAHVADGHAGDAGPVRAAAAAPREAVLVFGGDLVPHGEVLRSMASKGGASLFAPIVETLRAADIAMLNFETPAAPSRPIPTSQMQFNVHEDFVRAVAEAGLDAVSVANNHGYDAGVDAVGETVRTLRAANVVAMGGALPDEDPLVPSRITVMGETLCVFAATRLLNFDMEVPGPGRARLGIAREAINAEREGFINAVRNARAQRCTAVMVSLHTGTEYTDRPEARDRTFFRRCADAGADVVIGHHSHTPHPVEMYRVPRSERVVPIFYSLGNFLSNQGAAAEAGVDPEPGAVHNVNFDARTREGLLAIVRFRRPAAGRLEIARAGWVPLWTINTPLRRRAGEAQTIQAALMPWEGGGDTLLRARWASLLRRVGAESLLDRAEVPAFDAAYEASTRAVLAAREETRRPSRSERSSRTRGRSSR